MPVLEYDEEATRRLLAVYVTPDVIEQRSEFLRAFGPRPGERVLDVGAGPGFLAAAIAESVGELGSVLGIDVSEPLLKIARAQSGSLPNVDFQYGEATKLPCPDGELDAVVSTQVLEYVSNVEAALAEFHRVLRKGGRVALLDTDWDSIVWHSVAPDLMKRVLTAWEDHAADPFLPRTLARKLEHAGFEVTAQDVIPLLNSEFDPDTYSNRMIDLIVPFVAERGGIAQGEAEAWGRALRDHGSNGEYFFSLNRYLFLAKKP